MSLQSSRSNFRVQNSSPPAQNSEDPNQPNGILQSTTKISIDRLGLYNPPKHSHKPSSDSDLVNHLKGIKDEDLVFVEMLLRQMTLLTLLTLLFNISLIIVALLGCQFLGGSILVAEYMEEVQTNPKAGFYINSDVFGAQGDDFITSPEVSQTFG